MKLGSSTRSFTHDVSVSVSFDPNVCRKRDFEIAIETIFDPSPLQKVDSTISISHKNMPRIVVQKNLTMETETAETATSCESTVASAEELE